jgi:hypothetical protein
MKRCLALFFLMAFLATAAFAAGPKEYQWTGTVTELKDDVIVVEKGKEKWEIGRDNWPFSDRGKYFQCSWRRGRVLAARLNPPERFTVR